MTDISFPCFKIHWSVLHDTDGQWPKVYCESNLRLRSVIMFCNENVFGPTDHSPSPAPALSWWLGKSAWLGPPVPRHCEGSSCAPRLAASRAGLNPSRGLHRPHPLTTQSNHELVWVSRDTMFWELYLLIKHSSWLLHFNWCYKLHQCPDIHGPVCKWTVTLLFCNIKISSTSTSLSFWSP